MQLIILVVLNISSSAIELLTITAVGPFILALTNPEIPFNYIVSLNINSAMKIMSAKDIVLPIITGFIFLIIVSALFRSIVIYYGTRISFSLGSEVSTACYRAYLNKTYLEIVNSHTSTIINNVFSNVNLIIYQIINPVINLISAVSFILLLIIFMLIINAKATTVTFLFMAMLYFLFYKFFKKENKKNSKEIDLESSKIIKALQDGIGGIRDIILDGTQKIFLDDYEKSDIKLRKIQGFNHFVNTFPRIGVEATAMLLIAIVGYLIFENSELGLALPTLAFIAMSGQRLLPALQQCFISVNNINSSVAALNKINKLILFDNKINTNKKNLITNAGLNFRKSIILKDIGIELGSHKKQILREINIEIKKGERIGIIGKTGSGKSTLVDMVMGLLFPTTGTFIVDSTELNITNIEEWRKKIAHVPQSIFIRDASIKNNIAFGISEEMIDYDKINSSIKIAQLTDLIEELPNGVNSIVGERGAFLSGGQRQRIGIARALYKNSQILILDEATSALDEDTENSVMNGIYNLNQELTILVVAHRVSTLKRCDRIIQIDSGKINANLDYKDII